MDVVELFTLKARQWFYFDGKKYMAEQGFTMANGEKVFLCQDCEHPSRWKLMVFNDTPILSIMKTGRDFSSEDVTLIDDVIKHRS